jgi:hypothetical protein
VRIAVEDQLVVAADLVDVDQRLVEAADLFAEELEAEVVFADDERAGAGVDQKLSAGGVQVGDRVLVIEPPGDQFLVVPEVFADRQARGQVADANEVFGLIDRAGLEIAGFVEDVVCGQQGLEVAGVDLAVAQEGDRIVQRPAYRGCGRRSR